MVGKVSIKRGGKKRKQLNRVLLTRYIGSLGFSKVKLKTYQEDLDDVPVIQLQRKAFIHEPSQGLHHLPNMQQDVKVFLKGLRPNCFPSQDCTLQLQVMQILEYSNWQSQNQKGYAKHLNFWLTQEQKASNTGRTLQIWMVNWLLLHCPANVPLRVIIQLTHVHVVHQHLNVKLAVEQLQAAFQGQLSSEIIEEARKLVYIQFIAFLLISYIKYILSICNMMPPFDIFFP